MNERIKELMVELKKTVSTHRGDAVLIGYDEIEKFAELIVGECMELVEGYTKQRTHTTFYKAEEQIKQHFGVEE